ncbi:MAG: PEP-CTERM sorting domain-containing protein [Pirellulales bacterium]
MILPDGSTAGPPACHQSRRFHRLHQYRVSAVVLSAFVPIIPEPGSLVLLAIGLLAVVPMAVRHRRKA